ncbi:FecR domain-containing protein [Candidatus Pelagibacter sp.]|nr:FecR domain-containing protein [Candidatus Pelagibacter sp.]
MKLFLKILIICFLSTQTFASNEKIGVMGFVIGDVFNQKGEKLKVGDSIFFGDTISANDGAKSQLLFIDQTVMTIGSDTKLTIDEFIFDPSENSGKLLTTIISGSVKILTGKISEKNPANLEVKTPAGTVGTRGTEFKASVDPLTTQSKILLVGPGPNNSLNLRAGAVEVSNELGTVTLDQPYLFTELTQNRAPTEATVIPQAELKEFQKLEVEPKVTATLSQDDESQSEEESIEITESDTDEENIPLVENDNLQENTTEELILIDEAEINSIIKNEIFTEEQSESDLVVETLVAALAKDDGGITAQMLGKSFLNSGNDIRPNLDLPEGMILNSEEANIFMEEKAMQEIEKVMLVSARVKDVEYVPTKLNQLSSFDDIRVPILNDETGDVVYLDMGNIDFKPQVLPSNFNEEQPQLLPRIPEQLFLKGGDENVFIDFEEGQFFETVTDPEIEILDQKYQAALDAGATQDEIEEIFIEMDQVMEKADESLVVINMARMENEIMPAGLNMDFLSAEEFIKEQDSFLFKTDEYTDSWEQAEEGKVAIFKIDGSVDYVDQEDANAAWEEADKAYEQEFAAAFPEIYQAEKKAEALMAKADAQAEQLFSNIDQLIQSGATEEEIEEAFTKVDAQMNQVYFEVDAAFEEVMLVEMKTDVLMMAEEAASLKYEINNAKKTGMLNGKELSEAEIKEFEEEVKFLELEVENTKENYLEEVKFVNQVLDIRQADMQVEFETPEIDFQLASLDIEQNLQIQEAQIQEEQGLQQEFQAIEMFYIGPEAFLEEPERQIDDVQQQNTISAGTTTYADLNTQSSGVAAYMGNATNLTVTSAASNAVVASQVGSVVGNFAPIHEINYSTRTIGQGATVTVNALGRNTTARVNFALNKTHSYSSSDTGSVKPSVAFTVNAAGAGTEVNSSLTSTVTNDVTTGNTYLEPLLNPANTNYLVTVSSEATNTAGTAAKSIQTTVTVESDGGVGGDTNRASGTDSGVDAIILIPGG